MSSINTFTICGNLTRDAVLRHTPAGTPCTTLFVALDSVFTDAKGNRQERADFIPVTVFGRTADSACKYLKRGAGVCVTGHLRSWYKPETKEGGFSFEADQVQYLGRGAARNGASQSDSPAGVHDPLEDDPWVRAFDGLPPLAPKAGTVNETNTSSAVVV